MLRTAAKLMLLSVMVVAGTTGIVYLEKHKESYELREQLEREKDKNQKLAVMVDRLQSQTRRAEMIVTEQSKDAAGKPTTTLLFVEYDKKGEALPAKRFTIEGTMAHIDALVVKFEGQYVMQNDPLRGHSVALFTRIYGESQPPEQAFAIDEPGAVPAVYHGADPRVSAFEQSMWKDFWKLATDESYRRSVGVRVAQGEGVWGPFEPGRLYSIDLEADGGLNLTSEPLRGIYNEALRRQWSSTTVTK